MSVPWDVSRTEEGRGRLIELVEDYTAAGMEREAGICLAKLADVIKHVGAPEGGNAFVECAKTGADAVRLLRKSGDKKSLCRALRIAAVPFVTDNRPMLEESSALAREIGDLEEEAWTTFAMRGINTGEADPHSRKALELFEACGSLAGQACCLLSMGFKIGSHNPELLRRSIELFEQAGDEVAAERGRKYLEVALMPDDENEEAPISAEDLEAIHRFFATGSCDDGECGTAEPK